MAQPKAEEAFKKVETLRKNHPDLTVAQAAKKAGVKEFNYYRGQAYLKAKSKTKAKAEPKRKKLRRTKHGIINMPEANGMKMTVLMGTPEQIRQVLA